MPLPTPIKRRLNELELRSRLRARPRLQGRILAPAGLRRRLPTTHGIYFPFYHDVPPEYASSLRRHLGTFRKTGPLVSWPEALSILEARAGQQPEARAGQQPEVREEQQAEGQAGRTPVFCLSFDDGHRSWPEVVVPILRELDVPATFFLTTGLVGHRAERTRLTWPDCRDMVTAGFRFGSHTVTHPRLADLPDDDAAAEIRDSKHEIEDQLGVEVTDFAAPYGNPAVDYLDRDVRTARDAGFRSFASTRRDPMHPGDSPMAINRQGLHPAWPILAVRTRVHA